MNKTFSEKFKKAQKKSERIILFLTNKPIITVSIILLICLLTGLIIFYSYVFLPMHDDLEYDLTEFNLKDNYYEKVIEIWEKESDGNSVINKKRKRDIFSPDIDFEIDREKEIISETNKEDSTNDSNETHSEDDLTEEMVESLLVETLFELYSLQEKKMPSISERSLIWESLGLGKADEYKGYYYQNVIFLETLKEKI